MSVDVNARGMAAEALAAAGRAEEKIPGAVSDWLEKNVDPETGYVLDSSLTVAGAAADAKATGDAVGELKSALTYKADKVYGGATSNTAVELTGGKAWYSTLGTMVNGSNRAAGGPVEITPDMKAISVASGYTMLLYGNDDGIGHALSSVSSWSTAAVTIENNIQYKYLFVMIAKSSQADFTPSDDLSNVVNIAKYNASLAFALDLDLDELDVKVTDDKSDLFTTEKTIGYVHLNLHEANLSNKRVLSTNGAQAVADSTRVSNINLIPIVPNTPIYYTRPASGYFNPYIYYFKNGVYQGYDSNFVSGKSYDADAARFLFFKNPTSLDISPQDVASNYIIWQEAADSYNNRLNALEGGNDYSLIAYGDSLTTGAGASDANHTYWGVCAAQLSMKNRIGFGYGGSQSRPIAFTAGALTGYVPPSTRAFALKYADLTTDISIASNALNGKTVIIDGQEYTIGQTGVNAYSLPDSYTPVGYWVPATVKNSRYTADVYVIWVGTNDGGMQWDIIDSMIAKLPHKRYVVFGLTRLGTDTSVADELKGYEKYGSHYLNIRMQIINSAFALIGKTPTDEDTTAMNAGLMPPSLMSDNTHFNDDGYEAIGKLLALHIKSLGYSFQSEP